MYMCRGTCEALHWSIAIIQLDKTSHVQQLFGILSNHVSNGKHFLYLTKMQEMDRRYSQVCDVHQSPKQCVFLCCCFF